MTVDTIKTILNADVLYGEELLEREVLAACGCDLMSDVLAFVKEQGVLLTGLVNPQAVRTAEMLDMTCIVFVRGKRPDSEIVALAERRKIVVLCTKLELFTACTTCSSTGSIS